MRVSTTVQFDRASTIMNKLQNDLGTSQAKVSVQKQILNPSDKPDQTATILRLNSVIDRQTTYGRTIEMLQARLDNESATLTSASEVLVRIKELAVQANNGTQGLTSRKIIATEIKACATNCSAWPTAPTPRATIFFWQPGSHTRLC